MKIYLAGGIANLSDNQVHGWRDECQSDYSQHEYRDPTRRDYRGVECTFNVSRMIVKNDKADIRHCDVLLAYCPRPSWGTAMEIYYAFETLQKWVVIVTDDFHPSPWLVDHSDYITDSFEKAFDFIANIAKDEPTLPQRRFDFDPTPHCFDEDCWPGQSA